MRYDIQPLQSASQEQRGVETELKSKAEGDSDYTLPRMCWDHGRLLGCHCWVSSGRGQAKGASQLHPQQRFSSRVLDVRVVDPVVAEQFSSGKQLRVD